MIYLESPSNDAAFNLAMEEYAFSNLSKEHEYFMLWQNRSAVIIGKHQNVQEEVNIPYVQEQGISVVRRLSGGGAVYHDLGNLNFTYIVNGDDPEISMERFAGPLLLACKEFGIEAEINGRNDILVQGKKFSGNARYQQDGRIMHHGTILINSQIEPMVRVLQVSPDKYISKGIASVRSRVANLSDYAKNVLTVDIFKEVFRKYVNPEGQYIWTKEDLDAIKKIQDIRYGTWEWNYGSFPIYQVERERRVEGCGKIKVHLNIVAGRIEDLLVTGDFLGSRAIEELTDILMDCRLQKEDLMARLANVEISAYIYGMDNERFAEILCEN